MGERGWLGRYCLGASVISGARYILTRCVTLGFFLLQVLILKAVVDYFHLHRSSDCGLLADHFVC